MIDNQGGEMVCPNCGKGTKGVKLNGKLFCNFCGELVMNSTEVLEDSYEHAAPTEAAEPKATPASEAKIITPDNQEITIEDEPETTEEPKAPKAETKILDAVDQRKPEVPKKKIGNASIRKHQRPRADAKPFDLIPGEPDPINEPELESPHDDLVEKMAEPATRKELDNEPIADKSAPKKEEEKPVFALMAKEEHEALARKKKQKQDAFTSFLKETSKSISNKGPAPKKDPKKIRQKRKILWGIAIILLLLFGFGGLVYYVNVIANNENRIMENLEREASFNYIKPTEVPLGYEISHLSQVEESRVLYYYIFNGDKSRTFTINIEPTQLTSADIWKSYIKDAAVNYTEFKKGDLTFLRTSSHEIYVIKDNVLYIFANSGEIYDDQFVKFAEEMLL